MAASFLLLISAVLSVSGGGGPTEDGRITELLARGWQKTGPIPCAGTEPGAGRFYELESEEEATEAFVVTPTLALAARLPLPEGRGCREISAPQFIEEIR